jgi:CMP-N-acetylneuraminic acid synthetase
MLDALLSLPEVTAVVINTDARAELAAIGIEDGPRVFLRERRPELRGDFASMNRILEDDLAAVEADLYLMTHVTNPLLSAATLRAALRRLAETPSADSLFSVNRVQTRFYREDGSPVNHDPARLVRTQDLEPWYEENSCLYLFTRESFRATGARIGRQPLLFETPRLESVDIDTADDWALAQALLAARTRAPT